MEIQFSVQAGGLFSNIDDFSLHGRLYLEFLIRFLIGLKFVDAFLDM